MNVRRVDITTAADGSFSQDVRVPGEILGVFVDLGDLDTPDVTITDKLTGADIINVDALAADGIYQPRKVAVSTAGVALAAAAGPPAVDNQYAPVVCYGVATVTIAGGGATKSGAVHIAFRG